MQWFWWIVLGVVYLAIVLIVGALVSDMMRG